MLGFGSTGSNQGGYGPQPIYLSDLSKDPYPMDRLGNHRIGTYLHPYSHPQLFVVDCLGIFSDGPNLDPADPSQDKLKCSQSF